MTTDATLYEVRGGAAWITLNRPENRNALSAVLVGELHEHLNAANDSDAVRSIVITGAEPAFCSGADLKNPPGQMIGGHRSVPYHEVLTSIMESPKPVIAAVNGPAFAGGLGLVGAADIAVAAEEAIFAFSEVRIGVIPAVISVVCIPKLGTHHAMRLFLTGERFTGAQAVEMGLAHQAVPKDRLAEAVHDVIGLINLGGPNAVPECKKLVRRIPTLTIEEGFEVAEPWSKQMFASDEGAEGMAAFREKRDPAWIGGKS
ncbi:MAG: enoyl-CoA hydratase-related protein [Gammaproteobacteria bacterium]|nr:enoyl-CoA hydratase-related protein [Gammaproteobacteria bacterium]